MNLFLALVLSRSASAGSICSDGWISGSTGSGTCSHHGGIAGGGGGSYYPTYSPTYVSAPAPVQSTTDLGHWETEKGITTAGNVRYELERTVRDASGLTNFAYQCYPNGAGSFEEALFIGVNNGSGYGHVDPWIASVDDDNPVHVYAVKGNTSTLLPSWEASIIEGGSLILWKQTAGFQRNDQLGGVLLLTPSDDLTIDQADAVYVIVRKKDGTSDTYRMPMDGYEIAARKLRTESCSH